MTESLHRGYPGMKSIKDMPVVQEAPPPGGFPSIRIEKRLPSTGPTGVAIFGIVGAVMAYGFYQFAQRKQDTRVQAEEILAARQAIHPVLQAEWDLRYLAYKQRQAEQEAEIMKNVPGWKVAEPTTRQRWLPPLESWDRRPLI